MKKLLLALAAVFLLSTTAMAAVPPFIIPGNPWQPVDPRNESYILQEGLVSWANVWQWGDQSLSIIYQGTYEGEDYADVTQLSDCCFIGGCPCPRPSYLPYPIFTEDLWQNVSEIAQWGQGGFHSAYVFQNGDGNNSKIEQSGYYDVANVTQVGLFNHSWIEQEGYGYNEANVEQYGDLNFSYINQDGACGINLANVLQQGFGNFSGIYQDGYAFNTANVTQLGYMNASCIMQVGWGYHTANVFQYNPCFTAYVPGCPPVTGPIGNL
jgi:hypothetical protein